MAITTRSDQFVKQVIDAQRQLYAYILTLVPDPNDASDVLQQTNMALWRDSVRYVDGTSFIAWGIRVAYFKVLEHRKATQRMRCRFSESLLENMAGESKSFCTDDEDRRLIAMRNCLQGLPTTQQELVQRRYHHGESVQSLAAATGRAATAIASALYRIRNALWSCIERRLATEEGE
jgi:RNA polymerase sigma-70 factor, ECF subfamily